MSEKLTDAQFALLQDLARFRGAIWLRGERAKTAISMAATKFIALGPDEPDGSVVAQVTAEGREIAVQPPVSVPAVREGRS
jgi:hypothetical protein